MTTGSWGSRDGLTVLKRAPSFSTTEGCSEVVLSSPSSRATCWALSLNLSLSKALRNTFLWQLPRLQCLVIATWTWAANIDLWVVSWGDKVLKYNLGRRLAIVFCSKFTHVSFYPTTSLWLLSLWTLASLKLIYTGVTCELIPGSQLKQYSKLIGPWRSCPAHPSCFWSSVCSFFLLSWFGNSTLQWLHWNNTPPNH